MLQAVAEQLEGVTVELALTIPYARGDLVAELHDAGEVLDEHHTTEGTALIVKLPKELAERYHEYV